ncbi:MAG: tetratricopeptide repeat protein [Anaerolineae bacterium]|nr:tetratricopeptide repeat protein [Phycisphaerae bacterium]
MNEIPMEKAVEIALEQHLAGHFARAEALYVEILRQDPGNVDAIHLLGVLAHQGHKPDMAVQLIARAIQKRPDIPVFHYNMAEALRALGRRDEAAIEYTRATELDPRYFEAWNNLANVLNELGRYKDAEGACQAAIALNPEAPEPLNNLGNAVRGQNRGAEAIAIFRQALEKRPDFVEAIHNLAMCLCWMGQLKSGAEQFRAAIRLRPAAVDLHNNLGTVLAQMGQSEQAAECFQTAIDLDPKHAEAHNNLGAALRNLGKQTESVSFFEQAIELRPDFVEAHSNLASALTETHRKAEALVEIDKALALRPKLAKEHFIRGAILRDLFRLDEGIEAFREALRLDPDSGAALTAIGYALLERGDIDEAMKALRRSIELNPDPVTHSNVLMAINYHPGYSPQDLLDAHRSWATLHEKPHVANWRLHDNDRAKDRKLRIGYMSPDFRGHSVSYFFEPILENFSRDEYELFGYAHLISPDLNTWRLRAQIDKWRETASRTPDAVADMIREDKIDILVDLAGHTANNSLTVFARKPGPVQLNMIGFPSTTGLSAMDYRITDARCDPPGVSDPFNTEKLVRLPDIFWCYRPPDRTPDIGSLPADDNGHVTFLSINNFTKVSPDVQRRWAHMLRGVPGSRLIIQTTAMSSEHTKEKVHALFESEGVSADRVELRTWTDMEKYLQLIERSDITLDPYPFNGGTTTCHSLWMGAPVISVEGRTHAARMGLSMLTAIGLPELCAPTEDQYVQVAIDLANDRDRLRAMRRTMRERLTASPLLDGPRYVRHLEAAFRQMWHTWCESGT